jgi:hypothetical protein
MNRTADASDYFAGRNLALAVGGLAVRVVLGFVIPSTFLPEWRHTVGTALTVLTIGPWALNTIFRERSWGCVVCRVRHRRDGADRGDVSEVGDYPASRVAKAGFGEGDPKG